MNKNSCPTPKCNVKQSLSTSSGPDHSAISTVPLCSTLFRQKILLRSLRAPFAGLLLPAGLTDRTVMSRPAQSEPNGSRRHFRWCLAAPPCACITRAYDFAAMFSSDLMSALRKGLFYFLATVSISGVLAAELPTTSAKNQPKVAAASSEGQEAIRSLQLPPGFKAELIAAEPHLANPIAFHIDEQGRIYVCETFRLHAGVTDIRGHMDWLDEDLASRTVDDRYALLKRHIGANFSSYTEHGDRLRRLFDTNGDGKIDDAKVFADGFNHPLDG